MVTDKTQWKSNFRIWPMSWVLIVMAPLTFQDSTVVAKKKSCNSQRGNLQSIPSLRQRWESLLQCSKTESSQEKLRRERPGEVWMTGGVGNDGDGKKSRDRKMETDFQLTVFPPEELNWIFYLKWKKLVYSFCSYISIIECEKSVCIYKLCVMVVSTCIQSYMHVLQYKYLE